MTLLDFQLSTENQKGRQLATYFFYIICVFTISLNPGIYIGFHGLRVSWHCPFLCLTENKAMADILALLILKFLVNAITRKRIIGSLYFVYTHEYGDDLIRFSAFHR